MVIFAPVSPGAGNASEDPDAPDALALVEPTGTDPAGACDEPMAPTAELDPAAGDPAEVDPADDDSDDVDPADVEPEVVEEEPHAANVAAAASATQIPMVRPGRRLRDRAGDQVRRTVIELLL